MKLNLASLALLSLLAACEAEPTPVPSGPTAPVIVGEYVDDFGSPHSIGDETWVMYGDSAFHYARVDNDAGWLVAENDPDNEFSPGLFSKMEWTEDGDGLWFCQSTFDAPDADTAADTPAADPSAPAEGGCGGFPWSQLVEA